MTVMRRTIFAILIAGLLLCQLGQAQHYKVHFLEPVYQTSPQKEKPAQPDADDNCAFCLFLKYFAGILATAVALSCATVVLAHPDSWRRVFKALPAPQLYAARAPPAA